MHEIFITRLKPLRPYFEEAAQLTGVPLIYLLAIAKVESGFRTAVKAKTSSATGIFQITTTTWHTLLHRYAKVSGVKRLAKRTDSRANILLGAQLIAENVRALAHFYRHVKDEPYPSLREVYLAHFAGIGKAKRIINIINRGNGSWHADKVFTKKEIWANPNILADLDLATVYMRLTDKVMDAHDELLQVI